ncbi:unnamed protein product [Rotaria sp. Silwood1]|nr:unnamed protein product [Rotaria sp. Silwood1]CAF3426520.1 unnamed protein product [Rotaria sp. Silwood1]CAF3430554.1 unnamed protein product [Rotaria sp. Silwood1]CAF3468005.1 unnamed protein product [Rotaria sp. Silwood1]CAF4574873.1 unnamed protein product [Rotaria sp. Silwood1]
MVGKVELIPIAEGNRITVKENEKVIVGRGSSLGCNEKKISRHHAELLLKDDNTLWIKPTHANPVFYRPLNGKTIQLTKDVERELNDGDQIGLLPSSFFFRVSFSTDENNNNDKNDDSDSDSLYAWKKDDNLSPVRATSPDQWSPTHGYRRSISNQDTSVFDFDEDANDEPARTPSKRTSFEKKISLDVEPKPRISMSVPTVNLTRISVPPPSVDNEDEIEPINTNHTSRKLPKWMAAPTPSPITKQTTATPKSSYSRNSSNTTPTSAKRHLSFEGDSNSDVNESSNMSDVRSPATPIETKSPGKVLSKVPSTRSFDSDSADGFDFVASKTTTTTTTPSPSVPKRIKPGSKRRPVCQFGASCYRKNPIHRAEQSHPGDSDYEDSKQSYDNDNNDDNDADKPLCPFGKSCYRQNPQHKRDFKH